MSNEARADVGLDDPTGCVVLKWAYVAALGCGGTITEQQLHTCAGATDADAVRVGGVQFAVNQCTGGTLNWPQPTNGVPLNGNVVVGPDGSMTYVPGGSASVPGVVPVSNNGLTPIEVELMKNGVGTGNYLFLQPGQTDGFPVMGDGGNDGYSVVKVPPGAVPPGSGGMVSAGPNGATMITGGMPWTPSAGAPDISDGFIPAELTNNPEWGTAGSTNYPTPTNGVPGVGTVTNGGGGANDVLGLGTNYYGTNTLTTAVFSGGLNALGQAQQLNSQGIIDAINNASSVNRAGHAGTSNEVAAVVRAIEGMTNGSSTADTNTYLRLDAASNLMFTNVEFGRLWSSNVTDSNYLFSVGNNAASLDATTFGTLTNSFRGFNPTAPGHDSGFWHIHAGGWDFDCDPLGTNGGGFSGLAALTTAVLKWGASLIYLGWLVRYCMGYVKALPAARQVQLPTIFGELFGVGANLGGLAYPVYVGMLVAIMGVLPVTILALITSSHSSLMADLLGNPWDGVSGPLSASVGLLTAFIPVTYIMGLCVSALADMLFIGGVYTGICWLIRALPTGG